MQPPRHGFDKLSPNGLIEPIQTMSRFQVKKGAVLGAGVMGAQIAAHLVNVKVPVVLFDLPDNGKGGAPSPSPSGPKNGIVTQAVEGLQKLKP